MNLFHANKIFNYHGKVLSVLLMFLINVHQLSSVVCVKYPTYKSVRYHKMSVNVTGIEHDFDFLFSRQVFKHKTMTTMGPAAVVVDDMAQRWLHLYVNSCRAASEEEKVFVTNTGKTITSLANDLSVNWEKVTSVKRKVSASLTRHTVESWVWYFFANILDT